MKVTKFSIVQMKNVTMEIDCTPEQLDRFNRRAGLIQDIMPDVPSSQREFLISGTTPEDWQVLFGTDPESGCEG